MPVRFAVSEGSGDTSRSTRSRMSGTYHVSKTSPIHSEGRPTTVRRRSRGLLWLREVLDPGMALHIDGNRGRIAPDSALVLRERADLGLTFVEELRPADAVLGG